MRRTRAALALPLLLAPLGCHSAGPWEVSFADPAGPALTTLAIDGSGAAALAGGFTGSLDFGGTTFAGSSSDTSQAFIGTLDPGGRPGWLRAAGGVGSQVVTGVAYDPGGDLVALGGFAGALDFGTGTLSALSNDIFLVKLGAQGRTVWLKQFSGDDGGPTGVGDTDPTGVAVDGSGNITVVGGFTGTIGFGGAPIYAEMDQTTFVARLGPDASHVYSFAFGGTKNRAAAVAADGGGVVLGGTNRDTLIINGTPLQASGSPHGYVVSLNPEGKPLWVLQLGGEATSRVAAVAVGADGGVIVGGTFASTFMGSLVVGDLALIASGGEDGFVLALGPDGTPRWLSQLTSTQVRAVAATNDGGALVAGALVAAMDDSTKVISPGIATVAFAARLDGSGKVLVTTPFATVDPTGASTSTATGIVNAGGDAVVAGSFAGSLTIGGTTLDASGPGDIFAAHLAL